MKKIKASSPEWYANTGMGRIFNITGRDDKMANNKKYRELIIAMINQTEDNSVLKKIFMATHELLIDEKTRRNDKY